MVEDQLGEMRTNSTLLRLPASILRRTFPRIIKLRKKSTNNEEIAFGFEGVTISGFESGHRHDREGLQIWNQLEYGGASR